MLSETSRLCPDCQSLYAASNAACPLCSKPPAKKTKTKRKPENEDEPSCPVCLEFPVKPQSSDKCEHSVCIMCSRKCTSCPMCRVPVRWHKNKEYDDILHKFYESNYAARLEELPEIWEWTEWRKVYRNISVQALHPKSPARLVDQQALTKMPTIHKLLKEKRDIQTCALDKLFPDTMVVAAAHNSILKVTGTPMGAFQIVIDDQLCFMFLGKPRKLLR